MSSSDDMMTFFTLSICFTPLKQLLSHPPSTTSSIHKMDIRIVATVLFVFMIGCMGADPEGTNSTSKLKEKIFNIFHKTSLHEKNHAKKMHFLWNKENPTQMIEHHSLLYNNALSVIEEKCGKFECMSHMTKDGVQRMLSCIHRETAGNNPIDRELMHKMLVKYFPEIHRVRPDLTWSVVHAYFHHYTENAAKSIGEWTTSMKASLLYIHQKVREEGQDTTAEIAKRWKALYPQMEFNCRDMGGRLREVYEEGFQPTSEDMMGAKKKYDKVFSKGKAKPVKWTPGMKTDLLYIAVQLDPQDSFFSEKIKAKWDNMNSEYSFISEDELFSRLNTLSSKRNFVPLPKQLSDARGKYERTSSVEVSSSIMRSLRPQESLVGFLMGMKGRIDELLKNSNFRDGRGRDTRTASSSARQLHSAHLQEEEASTPQGYYQPEYQENPNAPIQYPSPSSGFEHPPYQGMYHQPDVRGLYPGGSSSTPYPIHGGYSPRGGTSAPLGYHELEHTHPSGHDLQLSLNLGGHSGVDTGSPLSTPRTSRRSLRREGGPSAFHEYRRTQLAQNVTAPIHPPSMPSGHENPSDYGMHLSPIITRHEPGALPPTPRNVGSSRRREGGTPAHHGYHQPGPMQDPSGSTHSPQVHLDFGSPSGYGLQTPPSDPIFGPQSQTPRSRRGEGSGTPRTRRRQPQK